MIKTALIRLNQPVSYSSSAQLNICTAFRPRANTTLVRIGPGPKKLYRFRFTILLPFRHYVRILQFFMTSLLQTCRLTRLSLTVSLWLSQMKKPNKSCINLQRKLGALSWISIILTVSSRHAQ